jgi:hypothetical protein
MRIGMGNMKGYYTLIKNEIKGTFYFNIKNKMKGEIDR